MAAGVVHYGATLGRGIRQSAVVMKAVTVKTGLACPREEKGEPPVWWVTHSSCGQGGKTIMAWGVGGERS